MSIMQPPMSRDSPYPDRRDWLLDESKTWVGAGLISATQRAEIGARYGLEIEIPERAQILAALSMRVLVTIAALALLAAGILLVVAANWEVLNYWQRITLSGGAALAAGVAASLVDRPGRRRLVSHVLDAAAVAGIVGVAAITSQHLQESTGDWLKNLAIAFVPAGLYAEARRNDAVAGIVWASFAGMGTGWLGYVATPKDVGGIELSAWSGFAAGLALAIRARGWWTPLFAVTSGVLLGAGLAAAVTTPDNPDAIALTAAGVSGGLIAVALVFVRFRARPGPTWILAFMGTLASAIALLWANIWIRLVDPGGPSVESALFEANVWITASLTAVAAVAVISVTERTHGRMSASREVVRWVIYAFGVVGAYVHGFLAPSYGRSRESYLSSDGYTGHAATVDGAVLMAGILVIAAAWFITDRVLLADTKQSASARLRWSLTPGAALAAGGIASTLWIPAARLIGQIDVGTGAESAVAWSVGAGGVVWIVAILAERARQLEGRYARVVWGITGLVAMVLAIQLFAQAEDLLVRGLTFAAIAGLLLAAVARQWLKVRSPGTTSSGDSPPPSAGLERD